MNIKKNQYKKSKNSILSTNQLLLERIEKQNIKIIRLKAKLAEARRVVSLHNELNGFLISYVAAEQVMIISILHACKIEDLTGMHLKF